MRRAFPVLLATTATLALAACGDDTVEPATADRPPSVTATDDSTTGSEPTSTEPTGTEPASTAPAGVYEYPTGADEVVLSYAEVGGFLPREFAFQNPPVVLVTGDGRVITPAATAAIFPGPLVAPLQVMPISEDGVQALLAAADEAGLMRDVDYDDDADLVVADASTAQVEISAGGETWVHSAYALGIDSLPDATGDATELSPDRKTLLAFVESLTDLGAVVGAENLGEAVIFDPSAYQLVAFPVEDPSVFERDGIEPTILDWPADAAVALADAEACVEIDGAIVGPVLLDANELTLFVDEGTTYQVLARPVIPGRTCEG
jgi:hypothetical protein